MYKKVVKKETKYLMNKKVAKKKTKKKKQSMCVTPVF